MKKITLLLLFLFSFCLIKGEWRGWNGDYSVQTLNYEMLTLPVQRPDLGNCTTYSSDALGIHHRICFDSVCILIQAFVETFPDEAKKNGVGGYVDKKDLNLVPHTAEGYHGWLFFNGLYKATFKDEYFLAYRNDSVYQKDSIPCPIIDETYLYNTSSPFVFPDSANTLLGISGFLANMPDPEGPMNTSIIGKRLKTDCKNFTDYFLVNGEPTNTNRCGFVLGSELKNLLSQTDCVGMRYFFGYEPDRKSDKIRIIFIGVDKNGENILVNPDNTSQEAIFIENEWPPSQN
ncbi:MAG: hypothetical protein IPO39_06945 [Bacteroidetes bacterium]|nr:hypothetical protein [Bacteroidota bacterium]